jgi:CDP-glucose 4,6-dehydratase
MAITSHLVDLRDEARLRVVVAEADPEIVLHMAAQALVPRGYRLPVETWSVNVVGTVMLLEALHHRPALKAVIVVTSDKVYANDATSKNFGEGDRLGGDDPYSASKAAAELAVNAWRASFASTTSYEWAPRPLGSATLIRKSALPDQRPSKNVPW